MGEPTDGADEPVVPLEDSAGEGTTVRLPKSLWEEIRDALQFEKEVRRLSKFEGTFKLNDLMRLFCTWALKQYWRENGGKPKTKSEFTPQARKAIELRLKAAQSAARDSDE